jgi:4a-hydroxytetrahydrobiopterin dehydratase
MSKLKEWSLEGNSITKNFSFATFKEAIDFVNNVAEIANGLDHHPDILISFNTVRLSSTTHEEKGLSEKDIELAEKIDTIEKQE